MLPVFPRNGHSWLSIITFCGCRDINRLAKTRHFSFKFGDTYSLKKMSRVPSMILSAGVNAIGEHD